MAEGAGAAPAPSSQGLSGAERIGGNLEGRLVLSAVWLGHEPDLLEQGQQTLSLLHLLQRAKERVGLLPFPIRSRGSYGTDRGGADLEDGSGFRAPQEDSGRRIQAKADSPGGSRIGSTPPGAGVENHDGKPCRSKRERRGEAVRVRDHPGERRPPGAPHDRDPGANPGTPTTGAGTGTSCSGAHG